VIDAIYDLGCGKLAALLASHTRIDSYLSMPFFLSWSVRQSPGSRTKGQSQPFWQEAGAALGTEGAVEACAEAAAGAAIGVALSFAAEEPPPAAVAVSGCGAGGICAIAALPCASPAPPKTPVMPCDFSVWVRHSPADRMNGHSKPLLQSAAQADAFPAKNTTHAATKKMRISNIQPVSDRYSTLA
jgi:hypothetical protein